jgi:flagellar basal body-associated protein FliL
LPFPLSGDLFLRRSTTSKGGTQSMSILWIILIVVLVLALLGFFSRGYW